MSNGLRSVIIAVVTAVWAANFTAPVFVSSYDPKPEVNIVFLAIIGALTASYNKKDDDDGDHSGDSQR